MAPEDTNLTVLTRSTETERAGGAGGAGGADGAAADELETSVATCTEAAGADGEAEET